MGTEQSPETPSAFFQETDTLILSKGFRIREGNCFTSSLMRLKIRITKSSLLKVLECEVNGTWTIDAQGQVTRSVLEGHSK